jgi:hypothetical protein
MTVFAVKRVRWVLGAAVGITCLLVGDGAALIGGASPIAAANARAARPTTPPNAVAVARRTHRRAVVGETIPLNFGYSAPASVTYGYAPGTYGGVGCYHSIQGGFVCP